MKKYVRVTRGVADFGKLVKEDKVFDMIDNERDWYQSTFYYNEEHLKHFKKTGSVKGIRDTLTDKVYFDFDDEKDPDNARRAAAEVILRLKPFGINPEDIEIYFSGNKGFNLIVNIDKLLAPKELEAICEKIAGDYAPKLFDISMYDSNQILRIPGTKHQKTGLYKIPLTYDELRELPLEQIKEKAKTLDWVPDLDYPVVTPTEDLYKVEMKEEQKKLELETDVRKELIDKPSNWKDYKWLLQQGYFESGERHSALMVIAATWRGMGYDRTTAGHACKAAIEKQAQRYNQEKFNKEELWENVIESVFSDDWEGGQYSIENNAWLRKYAERMGLDVSNQKEDLIQIHQIDKEFEDFVNTIDQNTVKTGISWLDKEMPLTIGMNLGIVGAASSGKTALALDILKNTSKAGVVSVFASLDMHRKRLYEKLLYKVSGGMSREKIYQLYKEGRGHEISDKIAEDYGNVWFYDRSCPTVYDIREYILQVQKKTEKKVKLVMIDYFERVNSDKSEDTAASKEVAGKLQDLVNDLDVCLITLVQPNKFSLSGGPETPITSYTAIKGSSFLYQSFRSIISIWRPFFNPATAENDKYMEMALLKNDLGEVGMNAFGWKGKTGDIFEMTTKEKEEFKALMKVKENAKKDKDDDWS